MELPNRFRATSSGHRELLGPGIPALSSERPYARQVARTQARCSDRGPQIKSNHVSRSYAATNPLDSASEAETSPHSFQRCLDGASVRHLSLEPPAGPPDRHSTRDQRGTSGRQWSSQGPSGQPSESSRPCLNRPAQRMQAHRSAVLSMEGKIGPGTAGSTTRQGQASPGKPGEVSCNPGGPACCG